MDTISNTICHVSVLRTLPSEVARWSILHQTDHYNLCNRIRRTDCVCRQLNIFPIYALKSQYFLEQLHWLSFHNALASSCNAKFECSFTRCDFFWMRLHFLLHEMDCTVSYVGVHTVRFPLYVIQSCVQCCTWMGFQTYSVRLRCAIPVYVMCIPIHIHSKSQLPHLHHVNKTH